MSSTLDPDNLAPSGHQTGIKGHDIRSLGPSESSDSGSDLAGPGLVNDDILKLDRGTTTDTESGSYDSPDSGASVGDLGMSDNSDRYGTGEHVTAGKDPNVRDNSDIDSDRIVGPEDAGLSGGIASALKAVLEMDGEAPGKKPE